MKQTAIHTVAAVHTTALVIILSIFSVPVLAFEFDNGAFQGSIDTTLSYGTSSRLDDQDKSLVCIANGGTGHSCNGDDGNLNYNKGGISEVFKITSDIEINHKSRDMGAFFRVKGFTDHSNNDANDTKRTPLSSKALDLVGESTDILDAYVWADFELGGKPASARFGKQVLSWGESTFIQGGINSINPIDVAAIRVPGAELREALLPVSMISGSWQATDNLSAEAFIQLDWKKTIPDPAGSYFSINDFATDGGTNAVVSGFGDISDSFGFAKVPSLAVLDTDHPAFAGLGLGGVSPLAADLAVLGYTTGSLLADEDFLTAPRGKDDSPKDSGQWGFALRYFSESLNDTEFGFYYMNYHSRLPIISAKTGTGGAGGGAAAALGVAGLTLLDASSNTRAAINILSGSPGVTSAAVTAATATVAGAVGGDAYYDTANYFIEYPEDIQMLGVSFNTNIGLWALQGEYSYKRDVPFQIDDVEILLAAATPIAAIAPYTLVNQITNGVPLGTSAYVQGYKRLNVSQVQATTTKIFPNVMKADQFVFLAEAAVTHVHNMPSKSTLRFNGPGTNTSGNPFHAQTAPGELLSKVVFEQVESSGGLII